MNKYRLIVMMSLLYTFILHADEYVLEDQGVGLTQMELEHALLHLPESMRTAAANNEDDRLILLNQMFANKRLADELKQTLSVDSNPEVYWKSELMIRNALANLRIEQYMNQLEVPDMDVLAEERYHLHRDKYALTPEQRKSTQLYFKCLPGYCDREEKQVIAEKVLSELQAGADFAEYVDQFSDEVDPDEGFPAPDQWTSVETSGIPLTYVSGLFDIGGIGEYSGVVGTRFGLHIIRLDEIQSPDYKPFAQVKESIVNNLVNEYKRLSSKEFAQRYAFTHDLFIDGAAMERIFQPYKN